MSNIANYKRKRKTNNTIKTLIKARRKAQIQNIRCLFHKQNNIYGQYLVQESKDIDRTIKSLEKILIQETP